MSAAQGQDVITKSPGETRVAVIGGGLVGALHSLFLAKRGFKIDLYERKKDISAIMEAAQGRSINLTMSLRGREALAKIGLADMVIGNAQPVHSRMIHSESGTLTPMAYDNNGFCLYSIDRHNLNRLLMKTVESNPNVTVHYEHQLIWADLPKKRLKFLQTKHVNFGKEEKVEIEVEKDFIFGCDGASSAIRRQMMGLGKMSCSQEFIDHGYKELLMPPKDGKFPMDENYLHIWPRGEFLLLGLPNQDCSFTISLFMPYKVFQSIKTEKDLIDFFTKHFQDSIAKIGVKKLVKDYFNNPIGHLQSIKCKPHFMADSVMILGDAAHAVVPFYGQGTNAGFEDCLIFNDLLTTHNNDLVLAAREYAQDHWRDSHAIADLSMHNYRELRAHVNNLGFRFHKCLDNFLYYLFPRTFIPLYTMVAFSRIPFSEAVARNQKQKGTVSTGLFVLKAVTLGGLLFLLFKYSGIQSPLRYRVMPYLMNRMLADHTN